MKKNLKKTQHLITGLLLLASLKNTAQPYGQIDYVNGSGLTYTLNAGLYSKSIQPGYIMAGSIINVPPTSPNFVIYRTVQTGAMTNPNAWANGYYFTWNGATCASPPTPVVNCFGVDVIESKLQLPQCLLYAAMTSKDALFLTSIFTSGNPTGIPRQFNFPNSMASATKPKILELSNGDLMITGSYTKVSGGISTTYLYLLKTDANGNWLNSISYDLGISTFFIPTDIIESPYTANEFIVIGKMAYNAINRQGFLLNLNKTTLAINQFYEYGNQNGFALEELGSIITSNTFPTSFAISGITDETSGFGERPVYLNIDINGVVNVNNWYMKIGNGLQVRTGNIIERPNNYGSFYDIYINSYGSSHLDGGFKLDPSGNWFSQSGNNLNDFQYTDLSLSTLNCMSFNNIGPQDEGLHFYGNSSSGGFYLVQTYFNGRNENCMVGLNICQNSTSFLGGPTLSLCSQNVNNSGGLSPCVSNVFIQSQNILVNQICGGGPFDSMGNNLKQTSINKNKEINVSISPNPTTDRIEITGLFNGTYTIADVSGRIVMNGSFNDYINTEGIKSGLYLLTLQNIESVASFRIIVK